MSKNYQMLIPADELATADSTGLDALIATNPDAYQEGTQIKIGVGIDENGDPVAANDTAVFIVLSDKTVGALTFA